MAKKNFRAMMVKAYSAFFMVVMVAILAVSCGKEPVDNRAEAGVITVSSKPLNGESYKFESYAIKDGAQLDGKWEKTTDGVPTDSAKASATIKAQVELEKAEIEINSSLKTNNVWSFDSISQPVATASGYKWNGYMTKNDGQKAIFSFNSQTAGLRDLVIGLEPVALRADSTKNVATTARSGERERMSTQEFFTATVKESGTGRSNTVDIPLSATYTRYIPENAPEVVDSIIDWTDRSELRSGLWALENKDRAQAKIIYIMSDGSRVDGPNFAKEAPRTMWGSEDKMYVSEFEKSIGASFSGSTSEGEATDAELSDESWTVSFETTVRSWKHEQKSIDGKHAETSLFVKAPHFIFNHGALRHDFGKLPLEATPSVELLDKGTVVEDGKSYTVKQIKNTISTTYGVDSTGIQNQQVISTVDLLKLNADVTLIDVTAVMSRAWTATQGTFTWKLTEKYSDGSTKDTTIVWSSSRSIEANHFDKEDVKKALSEGSVKTEVAHSDVKSVVNPSYTIRYKVATATYSWINSFVKESATSIVTSSLPENVSLEYKGYKFNQPADEISYTKEQGSLIDSYDDGSKKIYDYKANFFESVKGYDGSTAKAIATGTLTVNAAVPTSWELLSKVNDYVLFNHTVGAKYRVNYSDGSHQEFEFNKTINGESASTPVETTEDEVGERVGAPSDYILNKEKKQDGNISFAIWTTKVEESAERTRGSHQYGYTYTIGREVKYVKDFGNGVVVEIDFEDPTISHNVERTDFVQTGEEEVEEGTKYIWRRNNNLLVNINGQNNTINNYGVINIIGGHGGGEPEAPKAVIGGGIVSPKPGLSDNMYYVGYLIELNNGKVRPLIVDKNGQNVELGDEFDKDDRWNGSAYINGTLYPVLGSNTGSMLKYTYKAGVSYAISAVNAGDGFNWNHAQVENVTGHYKPIITKKGGKTILTLDGVANWSMSW